MKKIFAIAAFAATVLGSSIPALAASSPNYGSVKLNWSVNTAATMTLATQYSAAGAQGTAAPGTANLLGSAAGVCSNATAETALNISFGAINPSLTAGVGCLYLNALVVKVSTNDSLGFSVNQYIDAALPTGIGFCAYGNGGAFPLTPGAAVTQSARTGTPAAGTWAGSTLTCPAGSSPLPVGTGGTLNNGGAGPGQPSGTGEYLSGATGGLAMASQTTAAPSGVYAGEDLQLNVNSTAASSAGSSAIVTVQLVTN